MQRMQRDKWASAQSGISGEFEQLQGGHFYPAELGGAALPWNFITQTREENLEWLSAQNYIENLPERELQQKDAWGRVEQKYSSDFYCGQAAPHQLLVKEFAQACFAQLFQELMIFL